MSQRPGRREGSCGAQRCPGAAPYPRRPFGCRPRRRLSAEGTLFLTMEEALSLAGEKPQHAGKVSSATYLNKLFIGYV